MYTKKKLSRRLRQTSIAVLVLPLTIAFQNCSSDFVLSESLTASSLDPGTQNFRKACTSEDRLETQVRRLTQIQYRKTVEAAFGKIFVGTDFADFADAYPLIGLANDPDSMVIDSLNIDRLYKSSRTLAKKVVSTVDSFKSCTSGKVCLANLIENYGLKLWRRPLRQAEKEELLAKIESVRVTGASRPVQLEFMVSALLMSSNLLYRTEVGDSATVGDAVVQLTDYEIASLLSYTFWDSAPDKRLFDLAALGKLKEHEVLKSEVARMVKDPRFTGAVKRFFADYLKLDYVRQQPKDQDVYAFTDQVRSSLLASADAALMDQLSDPSSHFTSIFTGQTYYVNQHTADIFGVQNTSTMLTPIKLPATQRKGILSHPAFLAAHSGERSSGIVHRGIFTLEQLLCFHLPAPPADVQPTGEIPAGLTEDQLTNRELLKIEHSGQSSCVGCHRIIDPAGFAWENFDTVGRFRTTEKGNLPIDASGAVAVSNGDELVFRDSMEFLDSLVGTESFQNCILENYLKYSLGQSRAQSQCEFDTYTVKVKQSGGSLEALASELVNMKSFTERKVSSEEAH